MEIVIGLAIVIALVIMLGVDVYYILLGVFVLMLLTLLATVVFFAVTAMTLIRSRRETVSFDRIEKPEGGRFNCAVYKNDSGEYRNSFPSEPLLKKLLYDRNHSTSVRITSRGRCYDKYSLITIAAGLTFGTGSLILLSAWAMTVL